MMVEYLQSKTEGSSGDCFSKKTSDNPETITNDNRHSQDDVETMIMGLDTEHTIITGSPTPPMDLDEPTCTTRIPTEGGGLRCDSESMQLEMHPESVSELEHDPHRYTSLNGTETAVTTLTVYSEDSNNIAEAYRHIPLSSPLPSSPSAEPINGPNTTNSQPLHEVSYRNVNHIAFSSSPPVPENIALPPSSSPQWKEQHGNEDEEPSALDGNLIVCDVKMTLSSSPKLGQDLQDALSSDSPYNDLSDSTLVELSNEDEHNGGKERNVAHSSSPLRAFDSQGIVQVYRDEPEGDASKFDDSETSAPSFPIHLPEIYERESIAEPSEEIDSTPQTLGSECSIDTHPKSSTKNLEATRDISTSKKRSHFDLDDSYKAPTPKRMTPSLAKKQHAKLSTPFRSPLVNKTHLQNISDDKRLKKSSLQPFPFLSHKKANGHPLPIQSTKLVKLPAQSPPSTPSHSSSSQLKSSKNNSLNATVKASAQFKPPVMSIRAVPSPLGLSKSQTVQSLERKVQLLKRAVKIKHDEDEEKLIELVRKWKMAGREAAWDLWHIVREQQSDENTGVAYPGTNARSISDTGFSGSWGWASNVRSSSAFESNWGFEEPSEVKCDDDAEPDDFPSPSTFKEEVRRALRRNPNSTVLPSSRSPLHAYQTDALDTSMGHVDRGPEVEEDEGEQPEPESKTLGTMLRQFGIAHETLGWVEDEGDFIDD